MNEIVKYQNDVAIIKEGFSATNIKKMRVFFEEWQPVINRSFGMSDLKVNENLLLSEIRQLSTAEFEWSDFLNRQLATGEIPANRPPLAGEFNGNDFLKIGFTHHIELLIKNYKI